MDMTFETTNTDRANLGVSLLKSKGSITRFGRNEEGSLIIFSLFLLIMMLMIAGMGVDLMRSETHRARLQSTLDRAVLAGASLDQSLDSKDVVLDYFTKAGLGTFITPDDVTVVETPTSRTVTASARMTVDTYFMNMLGIETLAALAHGQAEESISDIEISLVVDISGSMRWQSASGQSKMHDLKDAAKEFVYLMQCDPDAEKPFDGNCVVEPNTVSISMVPYNQQVLVGEELLQVFNTTEEHTISSCVNFDSDDFEDVAVELDPMVEDPFGVPDMTPNIKRTTAADIRGGYYGGGYRDIYAQNSWRECRPDSKIQIRAFENDYQDLEDAIDELYAKGNTSIDMGMKWGAALLDPSFRPGVAKLASTGSHSVVADFNNRPYSYTRARTQKVVVLMTDGKNTTQYKIKSALRTGMSPYWYNPDEDIVSVYRSSTGRYRWYDEDGDPHGWHNHPKGGNDSYRLSYPEFWDIFDMRFYEDTKWVHHGSRSYTWVGNGTKNNNLENICDAAKEKGIIVFTVGFETSSASSAVLSDCASQNSNHFDADGTDISVAFNSIARKIHELRLTN